MKMIKYRLMTEVITGTEEEPIIAQVFVNKSITCADERFEENLVIAKAEAYNGEYTIEEVPETAEEARAKRDKLLAATDWTQVLDAPIDEDTKAAYRAYRQALRDVPQQEGFPETIIWPELPAKTKAAPEPVDEAVDLLLSGATGEGESA